MNRKKFKKWKILKNIQIEKIWYGGIWIATFFDWKKIVVKWWVLPDSVVDCRVIKEKKDYIDCQLLRYVKLPKYINNFEIKWKVCSHNMIFEYFENEKNCDIWCWWCKWQVLAYDKQLALKQKLVEDSFRFIWDKIKNKFQEIISSPLINWYRNKVEFSFGYCLDNHRQSKKNIQTIGFHRQGRWDEVVNVDHCDLISEKANEIYFYLKNLLIQSNIPFYNQKNHQWVFRHFVIRQWFNTNKFMLNLVLARKNEIAKKYWYNVESLLDNIKNDSFLNKNVTTFLLTYNDWLADVVRWNNIEIEKIWWDWFIYEKLNIWLKDIVFRMGPFSFFQTNTYWAEKLFNQALDIVVKYWKDKYNFWLDLYCWIWTIGISYLKNWLFEKLIWIELIDEAIDNANINAKINWLNEDDFYFVVGKAEKLIFEDKFLKNNLSNIDLIIVDPPRDWLHKDVVRFLLDLKEKIDYHLLYISCNPVTLARDISMLLQKFDLKIIQPVDMFPNTHHIENISFLV